MGQGAGCPGQGGAGGKGGSGGGLMMLLPLILMFAIFYFLLIRPQQKKTKAHRALLGALKRGDRVVTSGGLHGRITGLDDQVVVMEISEKVRVKVNRGAISGVAQASAAPAEKSDKKTEARNDKKADKGK
ncbi:MAG: preprotein translocase subunit YajC [Proteobacteria bacterium]|nr:preprotein translocase subunit YajC [Pseudomonadota bacterium]MBU1742332.1 preprotein translocase subunit YajC [Pseudomonadota bacterium]